MIFKLSLQCSKLERPQEKLLKEACNIAKLMEDNPKDTPGLERDDLSFTGVHSKACSLKVLFYKDLASKDLSCQDPSFKDLSSKSPSATKNSLFKDLSSQDLSSSDLTQLQPLNQDDGMGIFWIKCSQVAFKRDQLKAEKEKLVKENEKLQGWVKEYCTRQKIGANLGMLGFGNYLRPSVKQPAPTQEASVISQIRRKLPKMKKRSF